MKPRQKPKLSSGKKSAGSGSSQAMGRGGVKDDGGKLRFELLPWKALEGVVAILTFGALKYEADGWRTVPNAVPRYLGALLRHLAKICRGEKYDQDLTNRSCKDKVGKPAKCTDGTCMSHTRKRHIDCVATNALFLAELMED